MVKRWNVDPKAIVGISPYATFTNNPIKFSDPKGDVINDKNGKSVNISRDKNKNLVYEFDKSYSDKDKAKVEKAFKKDAESTLSGMNDSEEGFNDIQKLQNMKTLVTIKETNNSNASANSIVHYSEDKNDDGSYKSVTITPFLGNYDNQSNVPFGRWIGSTMTVETGHLEPEQIKLDLGAKSSNPNYLNEPNSKEFINSYTPLLNKATSFQIKYNSEKKLPVTTDLFKPLDLYKIPYGGENLNERKKIDPAFSK